jgi:prepilin-type N-terminal cleavage/methylation domain-containing protein
MVDHHRLRACPLKTTGRFDDEHGLTLIEMMVAVLLLGIILAAMASVIITSLTSVQRDEYRVRATQLGQEELERLRALEWDCVAFDTTDPDYVATYNGNATVALDPAECSDPTIAPDPSPHVVTIDDIDFTVVPHVYWIDDPEDGTAAAGSDSQSEDYKEFHVDVTWALRGTNYSYENTTTRVPTVEEVPLVAAAAPVAFEIMSTQVDPLIVSTSTASGTTQPVTVTIETSARATLVTLTVAPPSTYGTVVLSDISGGNGTRWQLTIPTGNGSFPVGDHNFVLAANSALGTDTATQTVTFAETTVTPVTVNTPSLAPAAPICVAGSDRTYGAVTVTVDVDGVSTTDSVDMAWTADTGTTIASPSGATATGARFTGTIPAGHRFRQSTTTLTIQARRISDNAVASGSFVIPVVKQNLQANCP